MGVPSRHCRYGHGCFLTHATEAFVSTLASDHTDGLALQAIKLVFKYLERSVKMVFGS